VRLRIEEDLRVADVLRACARQKGAGEVMEIALRLVAALINSR
jgi:hypothetical protein